MEVRILGPLEVRAGTPLALGGTKQRAVFAMLALRVNQVVSLDFLVDGLWGIEPPTDPANVVQVYLSRLRKALHPEGSEVTQDGLVLRRKPGYLLQLDPEHLDLHRFERLAREGILALPAAADLAAAALSEALGLWRGVPLAEFTEEPFARNEIPRLEELRLTALAARIEADLVLGRHAQLVAELEDLTARYPLHEGLRGQLMLSLYRSGRQAEALEAHRRAREALADELGVDPGRELRNLEAAVLAHDPHLDWTPPPISAPPVTTDPQTDQQDPGQTTTTAPAQPLRVSNIPARNPHFVGRADALDHLHDQLQPEQDRLVVQALYGLGGVGKTQLAIEYAHRNAADYDILWWVDAEQPVLIPDQLLRLATELGLPTDAVAAEVVNRVLTELGRRTRWLLIYDNAEHPADIADYRPRGPGHVLVTSRYPGWGALGGRIEIDVLNRSDTVALLRARIPEMTMELADKLAAELGDLPLAAAQAAGYLEQTGLPVADYLRRFRTHRAGLLAAGEVLDYQGRVDTTWAISLERLRATSPAAVALLEVSAFLAPEPIPLALFTQHPELLDEPLGTITAADPDAFADAVGDVVGFSLARRHRDGYQLHRLLQAVIRNRITPVQQDRLAAIAIALLAAAYPSDPNDPANWAVCALLAPHVIVSGPRADDQPDGRQLLLATLDYINVRGDVQALQLLAEQLHERWQRLLGPDHPDTLTAASHLASALAWTAEHSQIAVLSEDTLRRSRQVLGPDHPVTLRLATNLTMELTWRCESDQACRLGEDTLSRSQRVLGPEAPETLRIAVNLAIALAWHGDNDRASVLGRDALQRCRRALGPDHAITLGAATYLALAMSWLGNPSEEIAALRHDTLQRSLRVLGPDHPDTLISAIHETLNAAQRGDPKRARLLGEDTLQRSLRILGPDHLITLAASAVLALTLAQQGDAERARDLGTDSMRRTAAWLGPDHMIALIAAAAVTIALARLGATKQAQTVGVDALARSRGQLGADHPVTRILTNALATTQPGCTA